MSADGIRDQLSFLEGVEPEILSVRPKAPGRPSIWRSGLFTGAFLAAQVALLVAYLHFAGHVRVPGLPMPDATATTTATTRPTVISPQPLASRATSPAETPSEVRAVAFAEPIAASTGRRTRHFAASGPDRTGPATNPNDFATIPLSREDNPPREGGAGSVQEGPRSADESVAGDSEDVGASPDEEARTAQIRRKREAELERKRIAQRKFEESKRYRMMLAMKQEQQLNAIWREMIRRNTPRRTIHRDPNGQFMGGYEVYPNGTRMEYDRNNRLRHMDLVLPDGTRYSVGRDNFGRWNW